MGTCASCNTKIEIVESDTLISKQSVFQKLKELNQNTKSTIFMTMKSNKKIDNENLADQSSQVSEINDEKSDIKDIHGSVKLRKRAYSFQEQRIQQVHFLINDQNDSAKVRCFRFTDPNIPRNLSNSSSSNTQFKEFNAHFKKNDKQIIEDESKSIKSILKKEPRQKSETKSVHFAKKLVISQIKIKSKSCHHKQHKKKKKISNQIQRYENYQF